MKIHTFPLPFTRSPNFWTFPRVNYKLCCSSDKKHNRPSVARRQVGELQAKLERSLHEEMAGAEELGNLLLNLQAARQRVGHLHRSFVESFSETLGEEQRHKLHSVFQAAQMQKILPVFKQVGLLP